MSSGSQPQPTAALLASWCSQAAAGDPEALERLLCAHHAALLEYARRKVGGDWAGLIESEDVLQDAYVNAFAGISHFEHRGEDSFFHWLTNLIDRRFVDRLRRARAQKRGAGRVQQASRPSGSTYHALLEECQHDSATPSRPAQTEEAVGALMSGLARLPGDYRTVLERLYLRKEPLSAVAADMGRSQDAVRRLATRALERLREGLGRASQFLSRGG